ncbi:hypothetical protein VTJ04DRAFT_4009 [Mycothermus thermophilus]|uniref:uncharacterized protein n=1 Tax=Humicola insolens TaxID=85995 RepID=UPI003744AE19
MTPSLRSSALVAVACVLQAAAQHVRLPFAQHHPPKAIDARASVEAAFGAPVYPYAINVTVGEPPQKLSLVISPSTGHTWVPDANTFECTPTWYYKEYYGDNYEDYYDFEERTESLCKWGSYNKSLSTTYLPPNHQYKSFSIDGLDNFFAGVYNMTDRLTVGDIVLDDYPMGIAYTADRWIGVLGLGHNVSTYYYDDVGIYPNFLDRLVSSGKIASKVYSMWLDDPSAQSGSLLLGAVDRSRYTGDLVLIESGWRDSTYYNSPYGFLTWVHSINGTSSSGEPMPAIRTNDFPVDVVIGPGQVLSFLPETLVETIADMAGAEYNKTMGAYTIACDAGKDGGASFVFELGGPGGPKVTAELADLVAPRGIVGVYSGYEPSGNNCFFAIQKRAGSSSSYTSVGTTFNLGSLVLRRTYLAFDLINQAIGIAPAKFPSPGSKAPSPDIVAVESYGALLPAETVYCDNSDEYYSIICNSWRSGDDGWGSGSGGSGPRSGSGSSRNSNSDNIGQNEFAKIAIGVGVTFGVLVLAGIACGILIFLRLRRGDGPKKETDAESNISGRSSSSSGSSGSSTPTRGTNTPPAGSSPLPSPRGLPVIQEGSEPPAADTTTTTSAPAVPVIRTPSPLAVSDAVSEAAVSALSTDAAAPEAEKQPQPPAEPKGKEVDRSGFMTEKAESSEAAAPAGGNGQSKPEQGGEK